MIGNTIKTTVLLALLTVLILWIGKMIGGQGGMFVAFIIALMMNAGSYWFSDKIVLAMYSARKIGEEENPQLYQI